MVRTPRCSSIDDLRSRYASEFIGRSRERCPLGKLDAGSSSIQHAALGNRGRQVSRIGFGCWPIGGHGWGPIDDDESITAIRRALHGGVNLFDTADIYGFGHSEEVLSAALGEDRHDVVIATKFGVRRDASGQIVRDISPAAVERALEGSLRRLRLERIPLYQIHWPDGKTQISDTLAMLLRCRDEGKIESIGCSNFPADMIREVQGAIVSAQVPYNLVDRGVEQEILPHCLKAGIGVLAYSALAQGLLSGKYAPESGFAEDDVRSRSRYFQGPEREGNFRLVERLAIVAARVGRTPAQVALRWLLDRPAVTAALVGIKSSVQVEENLSLDWSLPEDERMYLEGNDHGSEEGTA